MSLSFHAYVFTNSCLCFDHFMPMFLGILACLFDGLKMRWLTMQLMAGFIMAVADLFYFALMNR